MPIATAPSTNSAMSLPLTGSAGSMPPSMSTRSMSPDRGLLGKIVGHLYIAGKILLEGRTRPIEEIRHEIRALRASAGTQTDTGTTTSTAAASGSLHAWQNLVTGIVRSTGGLATTISALPDEIKKELAGLIKQGKTLSSASNDATQHITKAGQQYLKLSGVSYL